MYNAYVTYTSGGYPKMSKVSAADAREQFAEVINSAAYGHERVILTRRGKEIAAVVSLQDLELLEELEDRIDTIAAKEAWLEQGGEPPEPWEGAKKRLGLT